MDIFGYVPAENVRAVEQRRIIERVADGFYDERAQLNFVRDELARRFGRRRLFRNADVRAVVQDLFPMEAGRRLNLTPIMAHPRAPTPPPTPDVVEVPRVWPVVDLTCDEVL